MKGLIFYQNNLKRLCLLGFLFVFFILLLSLTLFPRTVRADTHTAVSCSQANVQTAINAASAGDTVLVPACSATTWTTPVTITKGITLVGAGAGITNIKTDVGTTSFGLVYQPSNPALDEAFRITGFTFDFNSNTKGIHIINDTINPLTKIRIDHNTFTNTYYQQLKVEGVIYGVFDSNNTTSGSGGFEFGGYNSTLASQMWYSLPAFNPGDGKTFFVEDNTFTYTGSYGGVGAGYGARYLVRYNTWNWNFSSRWAPWLDAHGNQYNTGPATQGVVAYGNLVKDTYYGVGVRITQHRGGKGLFYYNLIQTPLTSTDAQVLEEYEDEMFPLAVGSDGQPQHVSGSYYWNNIQTSDNTNVLFTTNPDGTTNPGIGTNCCPTSAAWLPNYLYDSGFYCAKINTTKGGNKCFRVWGLGTSGATEPDWVKVIGSGPPTGLTTDGTVQWLYMGDGNAIAENVDFYNLNPSFNGTIGMGCGTLASRPGTCTTGVGYWATNQSCTNLTGMVGANPAAPISGTLYKCTAPNTWTAYYTPYTYPHPLRSEITPSFKRGDLNEDGRVDVIDLGILLLNWGSTSRPAADINQDGRVDVIDFGILLSNWG